MWFARRSSRRLLFIMSRFCLIFCVCVLLLFAVLHLPLVSVRSVHINPESDITEMLQEDVVRYIEDLLDDSWLIVPGSVRYYFQRGKVVDMIRQEFLHLDHVEIENKFFNTWHITATNREIFGTYCALSRCLLVDTDGFIFGETDAVRTGRELKISGEVAVGDYLFMPTGENEEHFYKIHEVLQFLEERGLFIEYIAVRKGGYDAHIQSTGGVSVWIDMSENPYDIMRALHATLVEIFPDSDSRSEIASIAICDPLQVYWTSREPLQWGCRERNGGTGL